MMAATTLKAPASNSHMDYDETLMYGQYSRDLGEFAKKEAAKVKTQDSTTRQRVPKSPTPEGGFKHYKVGTVGKCKQGCLWFKDTVITKIGEDWIFLTLLGVIMALLSFGMDFVIEKCQTARRWLYEELVVSVALQYFAWVLFPLIFICFSTGFVHVVGPNAIGSGIPEMKTILRGVVLKEFLTFRTLVSKIVGLCTSLGCGLPIGKEGPFVHVASIAATLLGKVITSFRGIYDNESRKTEMLAAACAVGVACTFAAPIGGVLFSIEVTATYFAVRNYWRGFYSAVCGAFVFRLLAVWFKNEETLTALFKTDLRTDFPFDTAEMVAYAIIGVVCGFAGALFVFLHRKIVEFIRKQKRLKQFLQKNRFIFPSVVTFVISSLTFPPGLGQYMAGELTNHEAVNMLFSNFTWSTGEYEDVNQQEILKYWLGPLDNAFVTLVLFCVMRFWMSALATTLPVPAGVFIPVFTIGAAFGRLVGESMAVWFPNGVGGHMVVPGGYAIVGAAALSGSVTHTVSTSVIVFELTGQMSHVLPCVIAVLISNAVCHSLAPSFYDSLIQIKKLPYLPDIVNQESSNNAHRVFVEDFMIMVQKIKYLTTDTTYKQAQQMLDKYSYRSFPLVDSKETMILLGSIQRTELQNAIDEQLEYNAANLEVKFRKVPNQITLTPPTPPASHPGFKEAQVSVKKLGRFSVGGSQNKNTDETQANDMKTESETENQTPLPVVEHRHHETLEEHIPLNNSRSQEPAGEITLKVTGTNPKDVLAEMNDGEVDWESNLVNQHVNFDDCKIDPAPFQLVERTSLYKVHSLFSLLGLHHCYVTNMGKLVGFVSLKEVRTAVQGHVMPGIENPLHEENSSQLSEGIEMKDPTADNQAGSSA